MDTENIGKYITAFFCLVGFIASPGLIICVIGIILLCNIHPSDIKKRKEWQSEEKKLIVRYGKNYENDPIYLKQKELARRQWYYRRDVNHQKAYEQYLGKRFEG